MDKEKERMAQAPKTVYLTDYRPPEYRIETARLWFDLFDDAVRVRSRLRVVGNQEAAPGSRPLVLEGRDLKLLSLAVNDRPLPATEYDLDAETLTIPKVPEAFTLTVETEIYPQKNSSLEGLYRSGGNFCTQCEAQGFRKITYFPDRPDILARYVVTITADREKYPVLLANGNLADHGELPENRHYTEWRDPFPKPSYLFALVAGKLARIADSFVTRSGRPVALEIYVEPHNSEKCGHAMESLKKAMRWDEETFGLEYDLDQYMIVAVDDFNMGAMENKGLNIFNSKYVLARPETATDTDYEGIEAVIAHEYFHNWTGNRVTCRDWFQLSLKEGLTVFRDQLFSEAMISRGVKRVHDVNVLRNHQFPEDAGPLAHPVRPASYIEINNFYTLTVYEKGAELIRMLHTLLGPERFRQGLSLYLNRHDGQAATIDDFVRAMEDAGVLDLAQFKLWYSQAGTPELAVTADYDPAAGRYTLTVRQRFPPTPDRAAKKTLHIPLVVALLDDHGRELPLRLEGEEKPGASNCRVLELQREKEVFQFVDVPRRPVPSLLRGFSAPVKLFFDYSEGDLRFLLARDSDPFSRWEAGQRLASRLLLALVADYQQGRPLELDKEFASVFGMLLRDQDWPDLSFKAQLLTLPSEEYLAEQLEVIDVEAIHAAREFVRKELALRLRQFWRQTYQAQSSSEPYLYEVGLAGQRRLKNTALAYLMALADPEARRLCVEQFDRADNMTDSLSALHCLVHAGCQEKEAALSSFAGRWLDDPLVMDKWFAVQATAPLPDTLDRVGRLLRHPAFRLNNPNRVRALIGAFCGANPVCFHARSGEGYRFLAEQVLALDPLNPQTAARLAGKLSCWRRHDARRRALMRKQLKRMQQVPKLSRDVYEVVAKSLA